MFKHSYSYNLKVKKVFWSDMRVSMYNLRMYLFHFLLPFPSAHREEEREKVHSFLCEKSHETFLDWQYLLLVII